MPITVLLVDDDTDDRLLTAALLDDVDSAAYRLTEMATYDAALSALLTGGFDVCLIDYRLGSRDGLDLLREARERGCLSPMILLTGSGDQRVDEAAMRMGAADYLVKGQITADLLGRTIRHALERAVALHALRDSEERFRLLVEGVSDHAIFLLTPDGKVASWNAGAGRMTGYLDSEIVGEHVSRFHTEEDRRLGRPTELLDIARADRTARDEAWRVRNDGSRFWAEATVTALWDHAGHLRGYAKVVHDITERRRTAEHREALLREQAARTQAEAATGERDRFLAIAAHELRTPLTTIMAPVQLVLRMLDDDPQLDLSAVRRRLAQVARQTAKMARMVNALLDLSRVKSGQLELQRETVDLTHLVAGVVEAARLQTDQHQLVVRMPEALVAVVDPLRLEQVLTNVLDNAIKYSPGGGQIEVELSRLAPGYLEITVQDHGLGIPRETRARVFQEFYRGHQEDYRSGMGIGLYISRQIVELHGGTISVESPADGGTRIVVLLPAAHGAAAPASPR